MIVEIVRQSPGELAHGFHLLRLAECFPRLLELPAAFLLGGDIATGCIDQVTFRYRGPGDPAPAAVLVAIAVLIAGEAAAGREARQGRDTLAPVFGVHQVGVAPALDLFRAQSEHRGPRRIGAAEHAVQAVDRKHVATEPPHAITLSGPFCNLGLERFVQSSKLILRVPTRRDIGDEHSHPSCRWIADPHGMDFEPAAERRHRVLVSRRLPGQRHPAEQPGPVTLETRHELACGAADRIGHARVPRESRVDLDEAVVRGLLSIEDHLDDAKAGVDGFEKRAVAFLAVLERGLRAHALGRLDRQVQNAARAAAGVGDRDDAVVEPGILHAALAVQREQLVADLDRSLVSENSCKQRADGFPDFGENLAGRPPECSRMLGPDQLPPGVVVEQDEVRTPIDADRRRPAQHDADGCAKRLRPILNRPERRRRPVVLTAASAHLAGAIEQIVDQHVCSWRIDWRS